MYKMLTIGLSAGGIPLIKKILRALPIHYPLPVVIVMHRARGYPSNLAQILDAISTLAVTMAKDQEIMLPAHVYVAPPDYHLLLEKTADKTTLNFALSTSAPVKSVRPSIDVLFTSAAQAYATDLIAVLLSGAYSDGADGMLIVKNLGGLCIVLAPSHTDFNIMPSAAIQKAAVDYVGSIEDIISLLMSVDDQ